MSTPDSRARQRIPIRLRRGPRGLIHLSLIPVNLLLGADGLVGAGFHRDDGLVSADGRREVAVSAIGFPEAEVDVGIAGLELQGGNEDGLGFGETKYTLYSEQAMRH
ncbi:MAG: hypothetical protein WC655_12680 [Candidatus Hydrogenedentales bacterium]|jgi:hypothetical protein